MTSRLRKQHTQDEIRIVVFRYWSVVKPHEDRGTQW